MNNKKIKFLFWVFWISMIMMAIWIIIKILGLIQTPLLFEIFPTISGFLALISMGIMIGSNFQKTNFTIRQIDKIEFRQNKMASGLINVEKDVGLIKKDINNIQKDIFIMKNDINEIKDIIKR